MTEKGEVTNPSSNQNRARFDLSPPPSINLCRNDSARLPLRFGGSDTLFNLFFLPGSLSRGIQAECSLIQGPTI